MTSSYHKKLKIERGENFSKCEVCAGRMPPIFYVITCTNEIDEEDGTPYVFQHMERCGGNVTPLCDYCDQWAQKNGVCSCSGCRAEGVFFSDTASV